MSASIGATTDGAVMGEVIFAKQIGDAFDGFMEEEELFKHLQDVLKHPS